MDVLKKTAIVLGLALLGAGLGACNKNQGAGAAPSAGPQAESPAAAAPGGGSSSSSGGGSSSSSGG